MQFVCLLFQENCKTSSLKPYAVCSIKSEPNEPWHDGMEQVNESSVDQLKLQRNPIPQQRSQIIKIIEPMQWNYEMSQTMIVGHQIEKKSQESTKIRNTPQITSRCHPRTSGDADFHQCVGNYKGSEFCV